ncbi:Molybdopterin-guanine dinucleotide biosynthesis protein A [Halorhabdus sp. SVX81]|uniref:molybdenum cofactor guanylyltransferase n=1 Tax=Halorhabdus sp. SVX81 TaxID=2978283 RepID=UPI0023D9B228|nr:molybdenum cofactor guanylyltransferase [Halorhabdus sp. SVX81]WEL17553.1 Molybdopterin-guanine dinucleotide biosynthesis protein A [Halorhabdus sp. SVX81]
MTDDRSIRGVVLAGGESSRFADGDKAFATVGGEPILGRVLQTVSAATDASALVVVPDREQGESIADRLGGDGYPTENLSFAVDDERFDGPLGGVMGAARQADAEWLFVTGCDMPLLDVAAVRWFLEDDSAADALVPRTAGGREPLHGRYRRTAILEAGQDLPASAGLHALLGDLSTVEDVSIDTGPSTLERSLTNVNTVGDLQAINDGGSTGEQHPN